MEPVWYYSKDIHGDCFTVYVDNGNGARKYWFRASNGRFVDAVYGGFRRSFDEAFRLDFFSSQRLGSLTSSPNLQLALRDGRLPSETLSELRRLQSSITGVAQLP
jgi:hypothetical protein